MILIQETNNKEQVPFSYQNWGIIHSLKYKMATLFTKDGGIRCVLEKVKPMGTRGMNIVSITSAYSKISVDDDEITSVFKMAGKELSESDLEFILKDGSRLLLQNPSP
jgi:hypothetical protein